MGHMIIDGRKVEFTDEKNVLMFDTVETENQLSFAEKLHFRVLNSEYSIENKAILVIKYVYTLTVGRQGKE